MTQVSLAHLPGGNLSSIEKGSNGLPSRKHCSKEKVLATHRPRPNLATGLVGCGLESLCYLCWTMNSARKFSKWLPDNSTNLTWINSVVVLGVLLKSLIKVFQVQIFHRGSCRDDRLLQGGWPFANMPPTLCGICSNVDDLEHACGLLPRWQTKAYTSSAKLGYSRDRHIMAYQYQWTCQQSQRPSG